jgi:hypothetical protein
LRVLVIEYALGGFCQGELIEEILLEGYAMLRALIEDLKMAGYHVITTIDSRVLKCCQLVADEIFAVPKGKNPLKLLETCLTHVDGVIVIAPAFKEALYGITCFFEKEKIKILGSTSNAVKICSNKYTTYNILKDAQISIPKTLLGSLHEDLKSLEEKVLKIGYPVVLKPVDGVGCAGLSLVSRKEELKAAVERIRNDTRESYFLIQEYLEGDHASVSLLSNGEKVAALSLNAQHIKLGSPDEGSIYEGGHTPFEHPLESLAIDEAVKAVKTIKGLKGYVGVDLVLTGEKPVVVEVNPRLTTSYLGLREILNINIGAEIVKASHGLEIPTNVRKKGYAIIGKIRFNESFTLSDEKVKMISEIDGVISHLLIPKPHLHPKEDVAIVVSKGKSLEEAKQHFEEIKQKIYETLTS